MEDISWSKSHFCTYLFLCIANADNDLQINEIKNIQDFLERMHIEQTESKSIIEKVKSTFNSQSKEERIDFIKSTFSQLSITKQQITAIMDEIEELILADNSIEKTEILMYGKIRKALGITD